MWELIKEIAAGASPLIAGLIAYLLGLRAYRLQREYELVRKRYLDEGLDAVAADIEYALAIFNNNWQHSLTILKHYRELDASMRQELLDTGFMDLDLSQFRVRPNYRVASLVGDKVFWNVQQLLFAFVGSANAFFKEDLRVAVKHAVTGGTLTGTKENMIGALLDECKTRMANAERYHILLAEVQAITSEFEKERFTLSSIHKFQERAAVEQAVARLRHSYADKLKTYEA
jgi:hypothetical protein